MTAAARLLAALAALAAPPAWAACDPLPDPLVELSHGSRYTDDSATRSDIDEDSNADVEAALEPVDNLRRHAGPPHQPRP